MYPNKKIQIILLSFALLLFFTLPANAALIEDLKNKISDKTTNIKKIEAEITKYQKEINLLGDKSDTLKNSIQKLNITRKKLEADIRVIQLKIDSTAYKIKDLSSKITEKTENIDDSNNTIGEIIRKIDKAEDNTLLEVILSNNTISSIIDEIENLKQLQSIVSQKLKKLKELKTELENMKSEYQTQKKVLLSSRSELGDRKQIVESNKVEKNKLLKITKNKESNYKKLIQKRKKQKEEFEADLRRIESQLQYELDKNKIPKAGVRIFSAPLPKASYKSCYSGGIGNCVTQFFGNTKFAKSGAYKGRGHNGMDFRASVGTKVTPVLPGKVIRINRKTASMCQYGKWVLIKHNNGLTSLYAHLNLVKVREGQQVGVDDIIAYTGNTGYATGPHLHLTVYASDAVSFKDYTCRSGPTVNIPIAAYSAYLNPLDYL